MTNLLTRGVRRETQALDPIKRRLHLVVLLEVGSRMLRIRVKGTRRWYSVPFEEIYRMGIRIKAQEIKDKKALERKLRSSGR